MIIESVDEAGIAVVTMDSPPVNALTTTDTWRLAEIFESYKRRPEVRVAILTATGRGFNAGVDIKEMQAAEGHEVLVAANEACWDAFQAVYECAVPVIAAVQDFCLGLGIGLVGNCDIVIAAEAVRFGLPEVDNGALGAATHLSRLVPAQRARQMLYTCDTASAEELHRYGTVLEVVSADRLMVTSMAVAEAIAAKSPGVIRAAKRSMNGIDPIDVGRSYRYEQGFTFELNLMGEGARARDAFLAGERGSADVEGGDPG